MVRLGAACVTEEHTYALTYSVHVVCQNNVHLFFGRAKTIAVVINSMQYAMVAVHGSSPAAMLNCYITFFVVGEKFGMVFKESFDS